MKKKITQKLPEMLSYLTLSLGSDGPGLPSSCPRGLWRTRTSHMSLQPAGGAQARGSPQHPGVSATCRPPARVSLPDAHPQRESRTRWPARRTRLQR